MISYMMYHIIGSLGSQVRFVNAAIDAARPDSVQYGLDHIEDPSDKIIEVHLASLRWDYEQRKFGLTGTGLEKPYLFELLDDLNENMPERTGGLVGTLKSLTVLYIRYVISYCLAGQIYLATRAQNMDTSTT